MCFTFFFVLSVSKARSIFILKLEGYSHWPVFFSAGYTYLPVWVFRSLILSFFQGLISQIHKRAAHKPNVGIREYVFVTLCSRVTSITLR